MVLAHYLVMAPWELFWGLEEKQQFSFGLGLYIKLEGQFLLQIIIL